MTLCVCVTFQITHLAFSTQPSHPDGSALSVYATQPENVNELYLYIKYNTYGCLCLQTFSRRQHNNVPTREYSRSVLHKSVTTISGFSTEKRLKPRYNENILLTRTLLSIYAVQNPDSLCSNFPPHHRHIVMQIPGSNVFMVCRIVSACEYVKVRRGMA